MQKVDRKKVAKNYYIPQEVADMLEVLTEMEHRSSPSNMLEILVRKAYAEATESKDPS